MREVFSAPDCGEWVNSPNWFISVSSTDFRVRLSTRVEDTPIQFDRATVTFSINAPWIGELPAYCTAWNAASVISTLRSVVPCAPGLTLITP